MRGLLALQLKVPLQEFAKSTERAGTGASEWGILRRGGEISANRTDLQMMDMPLGVAKNRFFRWGKGAATLRA